MTSTPTATSMRRDDRRPRAASGASAADGHRPHELEPAALLLAPRQPARPSAGSSGRRAVSPNAPIWNATCPPSVSSATSGPLNAQRRGVVARGAAALSRSAWVGYSSIVLAAVTYTNPAIDSTHTAMRTRSRRAMTAASARRCRRGRSRLVDGAGRVGELVAVVAEEQLLEGRRTADAGCTSPASSRQRHRRAEVLACRRRTRPGLRRRAGRARRRPRASPTGAARRLGDDRGAREVRSSSSVPVCTVLPARMMLTLSHSASTSARMWLESSTVRPSALHLADAATGTPPPSADRDPTSARRGSAARRRTRARRPARPSAGCPSSRCGPAWSGRARTARSARRAAPASRSPRSRPNRSIVSPPVSFGHRLTSPGHVREALVERDRVAPTGRRRAAAPTRRRRAAGRAAPGSWSSCPIRSARGTRGPRPGATVRSSPSSARVDPNVLTRPEIAITTSTRSVRY